MAGINRYYCKTCNTDLGADGNAVDSHLSANPTHTIEDLILDSTGTIATVEGITRVYNNETYMWDETRQKWLSINRVTMEWATPTTNQNNSYMRLWGSVTPQNANMGYILPYNATVTKVQATRSAGTGTGGMSLRSYGGANLYTYTLGTALLYGYDNTPNTDLTQGTRLCAYLAGTASSSYPQLIVEFAWRI